MDKLDEIIQKFKELTKKESVVITTEKGETSPFESSFGGTPYFPCGFEYPYGKNYDESGKEIPLSLLAQINFEETPNLEGFPKKGILQFYVNSTDDLIGIDFDNLANQKNFKIVYHPDVDKNPEHQQKAPDIPSDEGIYFPISSPLRLKFKVCEQPMSNSYYEFEEAFINFYNKETGTDYSSLFDLPSDTVDKIFEEFEYSRHRMGGYPYFTQTDPRESEEEYRAYGTLLLQIESQFDNAEKKYVIDWGDVGVGNFFIKPEDLANCSFSDVMYTWDCG